MAKAAYDKIGFHAFKDAYNFHHGSGRVVQQQEIGFTYTFENFFHPFVGKLIEKLNKESLSGMLNPDHHESWAAEFFDSFYTTLDSKLVKVNHFPIEMDVRTGGPYANYNWELLFHIPLTIAVHLSKNQRFAEAQKWFHYIFDPTTTDVSVPAPQRFWKFLAFRQNGDVQQGDVTRIDELLELLSKPNLTPEEAKLRESVLNGYEAIRNKPFQPHAVARTRHLAYQYSVFMKYLDNLLAWGDNLFRQDTVESINEATQRYVMAANLLGARPQRIPPRGTSRPMTFAELKKRGLDATGNALVDLEGKFPLNLGLPQTQGSDLDASGPLFGLGRTLYFCIPHNDKLLGYWDKTADRLFKIRNCMNIEGVVRQLALFDPPIDPGMLVKAAAAGIPVGSILNGLNQPISPVRSMLLIQKALELCSEVRGLGAALLSAIEKGDGERMSLLRQGHEIKIQEMTREVRFLQWNQAKESTESLLRSRAGALERYRYYQRLLGLTPDDSAPDTLPIDRGAVLTEENFDEAYSALVGQYDRVITAPEYPPMEIKQEGRLFLHAGEYDDLNGHADRALAARISAAASEVLTAGLAAIPNFNVKMAYWGIGGESELLGGAFLSNVGRAVSSGFNIWAQIEEKQGQNASKTASFERRADDWVLQVRLAARDLMLIGKQVIGSLLAEQVTSREYSSIQQQIEHSLELDQFMHEKFTNEELYGWMQGEISKLYYEYYRFAFDTARKAELTMKHELMRPEVDATDYIKFNYWDGGRKGLLSGESLYLDVKRMELAFHDNNKREYELIKHVSLRQLDPAALLALKASGVCEVALPEWLFDLDCPGHYMRRIKNVSLSIPSVTGPYTSVNCTLTLLKSSLRKSPLVSDGYARESSEDARFTDYFGTVQSIVTSSASNDSGLFEANLRDDRFLPFEGAGVQSIWRLELPAAFRQFDYNTISDVIVHVRYTARQGGAQLRDEAVKQIEALVGEASSSGLSLLLGFPQDFPGEWHRFVQGNANFEAVVKREFFPYFTKGMAITITHLQLLAIKDDKIETIAPQGLDLTALSEQLSDEGSLTLTLPSDNAVLKRSMQQRVFAIMAYTLTPTI
ncbi:Tc toxin subunit A-related protein [Paenibacillus eucommiae]|uniref:Tc toxin complex TcA C-terminal TcB-binding domain-containing protein n=1 Tax=Paenibacillus eucommiae TaxID=1355755 RepID=A0ABS4ISC6_9BACL|nr:hypothetical protein [Paenibacillus eucommiae]MBP1990484.1 hypothetical protein [Paenibacillus eucommiae]